MHNYGTTVCILENTLLWRKKRTGDASFALLAASQIIFRSLSTHAPHVQYRPFLLKSPVLVRADVHEDDWFASHGMWHTCCSGC
jgi:hypothetical protein